MHNYWIGFHHHLIDGERLRGPCAEAILQFPNLNLAPSGQGQKGEEDQGFHPVVAVERAQASSYTQPYFIYDQDKVAQYGT
jgi:hypothetical protein